MKAGAGGNWKRFDEKFDETIVKQTDLSCVSAVGEMLLRERGIIVSQEKIRDIIGVPSFFEALAVCLNRFDFSDDGKIWQRLVVNETDFLLLAKLEDVGVILIEPREMAHAVYVEKITQNDYLSVKDTFDQTSYKMILEDFFSHWSGFLITRRHP
jgi:ABC-type bacteriocin/lantibiotic exporter with double-glycine peptidase domain